MARTGAIVTAVVANPVIEQYKGGTGSVVSVGTTATAIPATNLSGRKGVVIQNLDSAATLYVRVDLPQILVSPFRYLKSTGLQFSTDYSSTSTWKKSAGGTNEYYLVKTDGTAVGFSQPLRVYGVVTADGSESLIASATVGALTAGTWGWGDGDTLGFSTFYYRTTLDPRNNKATEDYLSFISYPVMPDASSSYGLKLGPQDIERWSLDGSARIHGYCASTINVFVQELL